MRHSCWLFLTLLLAGAASSPAGAACPGHGLTAIGSVKGEAPAIRTGRAVIVRGVVTGDFRDPDQLNGFYMQSRRDERGEMPWGIFVYTPGSEPGAAPVAPGSEVAVVGRVGEFKGHRQIKDVTGIVRCGEPGLPEPVTLKLPETDRGAWRRYEGLLVAPGRPMTVTGNHELGRYGSLLLAAGGRLWQPNNAAGHDDADPAGRRLVLDDARYNRDPSPVPYLNDDNTRRTGSVVENLQGVLTHAFTAWRLHPVDAGAIRFRDANPRPAPPAHDGIRAAAFNVQNYFTTLGERGAASSADLAAQRERLGAASAGLDADLLALSEVENRPETAADLARRLGEAAGVDSGYRTFGLDGPVGEDVIRVMLAWNPETVTLLDGPFVDDDPAHRRAPLAGYFRLGPADPGTLVVAIHHKSKGDCPSSGDKDRGQGCWNQLRVAQSKALTRFVDGLTGDFDSERVLILGDINSYGAEEPVRVLREAGFTDLVQSRLPAAQRYSYIYQGKAGYLDTALASQAVAKTVSALNIWHINADEPAALRRIAPDRKGPWRSSDHDPVIVDLEAGR